MQIWRGALAGMHQVCLTAKTFLYRAAPAIVLFLAVSGAALGGILSRPSGLLATVWPANALMLGILLRYPKSRSVLGWVLGAAAYLLADFLTGASPLKALLLNGANLAGVAAGFACAMLLPSDTRRLHGPRSMLHLLLFATVAAAAAGLVGAVANPVLFGGGPLDGWQFWFVTELVNYIAFLPVVLTLPTVSWQDLAGKRIAVPKLAPLLTVAALCGLGVVVNGAGAIAFPVPALLWCAIAYTPFATAVLTLGFSCWSLFALSTGYLPLQADPTDMLGLVSVRLATSLICIAPQMLASIMASKNELLAQLHTLATRDPLTGVLNRSGFLGSAQSAHGSDAPSGIIMFDVDHFKSVNDSLGHAVGDEVLVCLTARVTACLRGSDLLGRLGGEEFAIAIPTSTIEETAELAERVRSTIATTPIILQDGRFVDVTVSVGYAHGLRHPQDIDQYLIEADRALYRAKGAGRNCVMPTPAAAPLHAAATLLRLPRRG